MEDEIDLRKYINVLLRHWKLIVSITLIAVAVAALISFLPTTPTTPTTNTTYKAKASLISTYISYKTPAIMTENEYAIFQQEEWANSMPTLITLVKSNTLTAIVIEQLGDNLEPEDRNIEAIQKKIKVLDKGAIIEIVAESSDADKAIAIANTWAENYESYINGLHSEICPSAEQELSHLLPHPHVQFIDPAVAIEIETETETETDSTRNKLANIAIVLVLGLLVGVISAFGVEYFRNTGEKPKLREAKEVEVKSVDKEE